jgi:hypothetical protein
MSHEYVLQTPDGDRAYVHGDGRLRLIENEVVTLPSGERFTVTKVLDQPGVGKAGVVKAKPSLGG